MVSTSLKWKNTGLRCWKKYFGINICPERSTSDKEWGENYIMRSSAESIISPKIIRVTKSGRPCDCDLWQMGNEQVVGKPFSWGVSKHSTIKDTQHLLFYPKLLTLTHNQKIPPHSLDFDHFKVKIKITPIPSITSPNVISSKFEVILTVHRR